MTTATAALPVTIETVEFVRIDPTVGWKRRLVLRTDRRSVEVYETTGNAVPHREYYGEDITLVTLPLDLASFDRIGAYLASERAQTLLAGLCDGTLSNGDDETINEVDDAREELGGCILAECDDSPRYWDAGDFFQHTSDNDLLEDAATGTDEALDKRAHDLAAEAAQDGQRLVVSEVRHYLNRKWNDAVADAVAYFGSDLDALATDADLWGDFDAGTQTFSDLVGACADVGHLFPAAAKTVLLLARPSAAP